VYRTVLILHLFKPGVTNLLDIAGHFVSYRCVSGPHNFLVMLWNLLNTKKVVGVSRVHVSRVKKLFMFRMLRWPHKILLRAACSSPLV